jgi:hypothetical protein
MYFN